jgi:hypothetical protein
MFVASLGRVLETLSQKTHHKKKGLVEWLKVELEALSSSPSTEKKKKKL